MNSSNLKIEENNSRSILSSLLKKSKDLKICAANSTKENKKFEFPAQYVNNAMTCENKKKGKEHFKFNMTVNNNNTNKISNSNLSGKRDLNMTDIYDKRMLDTSKEIENTTTAKKLNRSNNNQDILNMSQNLKKKDLINVNTSSNNNQMSNRNQVTV